METSKFDNQPEENPELPKEEDSDMEQEESGKREKITLEIEGQTIEVKKYYLNILKGFKKEPLLRDT